MHIAPSSEKSCKKNISFLSQKYLKGSYTNIFYSNRTHTKKLKNFNSSCGYFWALECWSGPNYVFFY